MIPALFIHPIPNLVLFRSFRTYIGRFSKTTSIYKPLTTSGTLIKIFGISALFLRPILILVLLSSFHTNQGALPKPLPYLNHKHQQRLNNKYREYSIFPSPNTKFNVIQYFVQIQERLPNHFHILTTDTYRDLYNKFHDSSLIPSLNTKFSIIQKFAYIYRTNYLYI